MLGVGANFLQNLAHRKTYNTILHDLLLETIGSTRAPNVFDYGNTCTHPPTNLTGNTQSNAAVRRASNFEPSNDRMQPRPDTKT